MLKFLLPLLLMSSVVLAQEEDVAETPDLIKDKEHSGASLSIVEQKELRRMQDPFLTSSLRSVAGLFFTGPILRGSRPDQTLIMVDGIESDSIQLTNTNIERVEVLRGPASALYGSGAMGGVINVITRQAGELLSARVEYGTESAWRRSFRAGMGSADNFFSVEHDKIQTDVLGLGLGPELDARSFSFNSRITLFDTTSVGLSFRDNDRLLRFFSAPESLNGLETRLIHIPISHHLKDRWNLRVDLSWLKSDSETPSLQQIIKRSSQTKTVRLSNTVDFLSGDTAVAGYEFERTDFDGISFNQPGSESISFDNHAVFLEYQLTRFDGWAATAAARYDVHSEFHSVFSARLTASRRLNQKIRLRGSFGNAFRNPGILEIQFGAVNAGLQPERVYGGDLGIDYSLNPVFTLQPTFFHNRYNKGITIRQGHFENTGSFQTTGLEVEIGWKPIVSLFLSGTYTFTEIALDSPNRYWSIFPRHSAALQLSYNYSKVAFNLDTAIHSQQSVNPKTTDLLISYSLKDAIQLYGRIENLFDQNPGSVPFLYLPDRRLHLGVKLNY